MRAAAATLEWPVSRRRPAKSGAWEKEQMLHVALFLFWYSDCVTRCKEGGVMAGMPNHDIVIIT